MRVHGRQILMRISGAALLALACLMGAAAAAPFKGAALDEMFPPPFWERGQSENGVWVDCVSETCGKPAHVVFITEAANPVLAGKIRSGVVNRSWAEKLADTYRKSNDDKVVILNFTVRTSQVPSWSMVYQCNCEGTTNYVSSRILAGGKNTMTFYSFASAPELAEENMNKMIHVVLGTSSR